MSTPQRVLLDSPNVVDCIHHILFKEDLSILENILARVRNPLGLELEYDKIQKNKQSYIDDPDITGPEKPRQTGNDIVMVMVVPHHHLWRHPWQTIDFAPRP